MNNFNAILAAIANLQIKKGDTVTLIFTFTNPNNLDIEGNPSAYPLNVFTTINIGCKRWPSDKVNLWQITGLSYTGAQDEQLIIPLTPTETGLVSGGYVYDIEGIDSSGAITTICEGKYIVQTDVQR